MKEIIPIIHCFDDRYVIPAAVSFYSMLDNASREFNYALYVLHENITASNQKRLTEIVDSFENASIEFINMGDEFAGLYEGLNRHAFSKEMFFKFRPASLFPQYDKAIITDVDVVFQGDISVPFEEFDIEGGAASNCYVGGMSRSNRYLSGMILDDMEESTRREVLQILAGFMVVNLRKQRQDNMESRFIEYAYEHKEELGNPEQQVINDCSYPSIYLFEIPLLCSAKSIMINSSSGSEEEKANWENIAQTAIQIHFSEHDGKAWDNVMMPKFDRWLYYLSKTSFYEDYLSNLKSAIDISDTLIPLIRIKIPFRDRFLVFYRSSLREKRHTKVLNTK